MLKVIFAVFLIAVPAFLAPCSLLAESAFIIPRASFNADLVAGIALVNPRDQEAKITFSAYDAEGRLLAGPGIINPAQVVIPANQQTTVITADLFGSGIEASSVGWLLASSPVDGLAGFFLLIDGTTAFLDGANFPIASQKLVFDLVRYDGGYATEMNLINPGDQSADVQIQLTGSGPAPIIKLLSIPAKGLVRLDAASFFQPETSSAGAYVVVDSSIEIAGFELLKHGSEDGVALNARRSSEGLSTLTFLQVSALGSSEAQLGVVNYSPNPALITVTAFKPDGSAYDQSTLLNNPVSRILQAGGSLNEDLKSMFGFAVGFPLEGWLRVSSTESSINGFVVYRQSKSGSEGVAISAPEGKRRAIFSHIATTPPYETSLAVLNPGTMTVNLRIVALKPAGEVLGSYDTVLAPGQKLNRIVGSSDFMPAAAGQLGGMIWVKSDLPVYSSLLIGTNRALSEIPAQEVPESYNPDAGLPVYKVTPILAIVPPGTAQKFVAAGIGAPLWFVDGVPGGSQQIGSITPQGVFLAPKTIPARQVHSVTAGSGSQSSGATADILEKKDFINSLNTIQAVAYMSSLKKIYAAELAATSNSARQTAPGITAAVQSSEVYEVSPTAPQILVARYENENIAKLLPYEAIDGNEYLLLLSKTNGRIIRLNPYSKESFDVVTGLNQPSSMAFDPVSHDLLVVEADKVSRISRFTLQANLAGAASRRSTLSENPGSRTIIDLIPNAPGGAGIAVDRCSSLLYLSFPEKGTLVEFDFVTGLSRTVVSNLKQAGQLLGLYRKGVTCPDAFHLLGVEKDAFRVNLVIPGINFKTTWLDVEGAEDLAFIPLENPFIDNEAVLVADNDPLLGGHIHLVPLSGMYDDTSENPSEIELKGRKADISVVQAIPPGPFPPGATVTYSATVSNAGPLPASSVILVDSLPSAQTFVSAAASQGECTAEGGQVLCRLDSIPAQGQVTVTIRGITKAGIPPGKVKNTMDVTAVEVDPDPTNNRAIEWVSISPAIPVAFRVKGTSLSSTAGAEYSLTISAVDRFGNVVSGYTGTIHVASSDIRASHPNDYSFAAADQGIRTLTGMTFRTSGHQEIIVSELGTAIPINGSAGVDVFAAAASSIRVSGLPTLVTAGSAQSVVLSFLDPFGNLAVPPDAMIHFSSTDTNAVLPSERLASSSGGGDIPIGPIVFKSAGVQTLAIAARQASSEFQPGASGAAGALPAANFENSLRIEVLPAEAASLVVAADAGSTTAGASVRIQVTARDAFGNTASGYAGKGGVQHIALQRIGLGSRQLHLQSGIGSRSS